MTNKPRKGFTIIELMLVMAFIALLMIAALTTTMYVSKIYTKGVTIKNINTVGRSVVDTMRRDFAASEPKSVETASIAVNGREQNGRICLTQVTYIWNTASQLNTIGGSLVVYDGQPVRLARIVNPSVNYCKKDTVTGEYPATISDPPSELLQTSGGDFAVHSLVSTALSTQADERATSVHQLRLVKIEIGTNQPNTITTTADGEAACAVGTSSTANFDFCSVAEFSTIMRVGSGAI